MNHTAEAFIVNELGDLIGERQAIDHVYFSASNFVFTWFFYETFDAHECHNGQCGIGVERTYSNDDLYTCRSRLLYYFEENVEDLQRYIETYVSEKDIVDTIEQITELTEPSIFESQYSEIERNYDPINIGLAVGYILKFVDRLIELDEHIKIEFN